MTRTLPRPVVDGVAPQPSGLGASVAWIEHRQCRVVGKHLRRGEHGAEHQFVQRSEPPAGTPDPVAQRGAIQLDPLSGEDLRLTIQRQMVAVLADQNLRYQRLGRHAAVDRTIRRWGLDDSIFAGSAAVARPADQPHPELSGDVIQHLSLVFADLVQRAAAAGAGFVVDIHDDLDPRQMRRQGTAVALRRLAASDGPVFALATASSPAIFSATDCSRSSVACCNCLVGQFLRSPAEAVALQAGELKLQPLDLGQCRAQDGLQRGGIVGQSGGRFEHADRLNCRCESGPMNSA